MIVTVPVPNPESLPDSNLQSQNLNARRSNESIKQYGSRLQKRYKKLCYEDYNQLRTLKAYQVLYDTLLQIDEEAYSHIEPTKQTKEEQEFFGEFEIEKANLQHELFPIVQPEIDLEASPGPRTQAYREIDLLNQKK
ncbi:hypothetical protein Glove_74g98 [Diversispora epigaea]|uniref:Uncharacterized protein n=1 Tax=Diversispora epigaea TaxID=1348612 RepID=A0A397JBQ8_9GLOM|nr:hypothetical protein Glove_74g98 [Diversispora epigaea]